VTAIISFLGGVRATVFAGLALLFLSGAIVQSVRLKAEEASHQSYMDKVIVATAKSAKASAAARDAAYVAREAYYWKSGEAENAYQAGRDSAIQAQATLVGDLRNGIVRLRNEWRGCSGVRESGPTPSTPQGPDEDAELREEGASALIGNADLADVQVQWLQSELIATRELYSKCMIPKSD
jgi:hypothetical protein